MIPKTMNTPAKYDNSSAMKLFAWFELIAAMIILPVMMVAPLCKKSEPVSPEDPEEN